LFYPSPKDLIDVAKAVEKQLSVEYLAWPLKKDAGNAATWDM